MWLGMGTAKHSVPVCVRAVGRWHSRQCHWTVCQRNCWDVVWTDTAAASASQCQCYWWTSASTWTVLQSLHLNTAHPH